MPNHAPRILVTGFGTVSQALRDILNPSFEIVKRLPRCIPPGIEIIAHPEPLQSAYHWLRQTAPQLIEDAQPDIVLHVGVDVEREYFSVERGAARDGYHEYPDLDRRTVTRGETQRMWGRKSAERLETGLDLDAAVEAWRSRLRVEERGEKGKRQRRTCTLAQAVVPEVRVTDDVGNYVCGFLYYASLAETEGRSSGQRNVVFLHVPMLAGEEDIAKGVATVTALIQALVEVWARQQEY